jgi:hypothetical protein
MDLQTFAHQYIRGDLEKTAGPLMKLLNAPMRLSSPIKDLKLNIGKYQKAAKKSSTSSVNVKALEKTKKKVKKLKSALKESQTEGKKRLYKGMGIGAGGVLGLGGAGYGASKLLGSQGEASTPAYESY